MSVYLKEIAPPGKEDEWPYNGLTVRQEIFCLLYFHHGNGKRAYQAAYNTKLSNPTNYSVEAWRLKRKPKIAQRLAALAKKGMGLVDLEAHLEQLALLRDEARNDGKYSSAIQAEVSRGKAAGLYVERREETLTVKDERDMSPDELADEIARLRSEREAAQASRGAEAEVGREPESGIVH